MRIKENFFDNCESYPCELQRQAAQEIETITQITEMKDLLERIKKESVKLRELFLTEQELKENSEIAKEFDEKMQGTVYFTLKNADYYQQSGWKKLIYEGEGNDERIDPTI